MKFRGDTPTGAYSIPAIVTNGPGTPQDVERYGAAGSVVLNPISGQALQAKANGRVGLLIHAGRQHAGPALPRQKLKPTHGCIRMIEADLKLLIDKLKEIELTFPANVEVVVGSAGETIAEPGAATDEADPPPIGGGSIILP